MIEFENLGEAEIERALGDLARHSRGSYSNDEKAAARSRKLWGVTVYFRDPLEIDDVIRFQSDSVSSPHLSQACEALSTAWKRGSKAWMPGFFVFDRVALRFVLVAIDPQESISSWVRSWKSTFESFGESYVQNANGRRSRRVRLGAVADRNPIREDKDDQDNLKVEKLEYRDSYRKFVVQSFKGETHYEFRDANTWPFHGVFADLKPFVADFLIQPRLPSLSEIDW